MQLRRLSFRPVVALALGVAGFGPVAQSGAQGPPAAVAAAGPASHAGARWSDIKECTYDQRAAFLAGMQRLEAVVDEQVGELRAKRAGMKGSSATREWNFAMKNLTAARGYLRSVREEMNRATPETWGADKEKAGLAWVSTQEAWAKVKSSTTS